MKFKNTIVDRGYNGKKVPEPHYSVELVLLALNLITVYLSRQVNGVFEIEKYVTKGQGRNLVSNTE